jgi:sugar lactone lactonase YvrE
LSSQKQLVRGLYASVLVVLSLCVRAQSIVTVAGGGTSSQEGLPAKSVIFGTIQGLAADRNGNIYISDPDANVVHRVDINTGIISIYAGNGGGTYSGDGGPARKASLKSPRGIVFDDAGNLYIADSANRRIRKVDGITQEITTFAGTDFDPSRSDNGDGGPATKADVSAPHGLAWRSGSLYFTDVTYNINGVRKIDAQGIISTVAGKFGPNGFSGDGGPATEAQFSQPLGIAVDAAGNIYIADSENARIRRVDAATKIVTTVVGGGSPSDDIGDGGPATSAKLVLPAALAFDGSGNLLIADAYNNNGLIRKYDPVAKTITRVAGNGQYGGGDDGPALEAGIYGPFAIAIDARQNIFVHDGSNGSVRRIDATTKTITRFAGGGSFIGDGRVATAAVLQNPLGIAIDGAGNLIISDPGHSLLRKVAADTGVISTIAGILNVCCSSEPGLPATQTAVGFPVDVTIGPDGLIYFSDGNGVRRINADTTLTVVAGHGDPSDGLGDGGPATAAKITPFGITFDAAGNLYIADYSYAEHHRIRKVDAATKTISTIAGVATQGFSGDGGLATKAELDSPRSVVVDRSGNIFIADTGNGAIRRIDKQTGNISTIAGRGNPPDGIGDGGLATAASLLPMHMAIDRTNDDLYFADQNGHRVRRIDAKTGVITTIAGRGTNYLDRDFSGDNGPAKDARLNFEYEISGVALDADRRLYVADSKNNRIRMVNICGGVAAPRLTVPAEASTASTSPTLKWVTATGASRYDVYLDTVNPPVRLVASDISVTAFIPANLTPGARYYWYVVAKGDTFCTPVVTAPSSVASFFTSATCSPGAFVVTSPANNSTTNTATVPLSWQSSTGTASYDVYLGLTNPPPLVASGLTSTTYNASVTTGTYSWFVVAHATCDENRTLATQVLSFQSSPPVTCAPGQLQPSLTSPAASAIDQSTTIDLAWTANATVTSYDLYFGTAPAPPLFASGINATTQRVNGLLPLTTYYWRVVARGPCDPNGVTTTTRTFTTRACDVPGPVTITFAPSTVSAGSTYTVVWSVATGLDADGGYLIERSTSSSFTTVESQVTSSTAASFLADTAGTYYHRVRAVSSCNPSAPGPLSAAKAVAVTPAKPNVVFTLLPTAVVAAIGERIENRIGTFALENLGTAPVQVIVGRQEIASPPFFSIVDPSATDAAFVTLQPRTPKSFEIRYGGPANDHTGSYQGVIFAASTGEGLAVTPYAFVNLKIGGGPAVKPVFSIDGIASDSAAFPGFAGDDATRPGRTITIRNPGSTPMDLGAEIGPEVWLVPEANWNATPLAPGESRNVNLFTRRSRSPNGSPLPRYTYFTVRTRDGATERLLVQDNDDLPVSTGRTSRLDATARSFIVPEVVSRVTSSGAQVSRLRLTNIGGDAVQAELVFTPLDVDGFDSPNVRRVTVVLPPNDVLTLTDPLQLLFHLARPATGSLEIRIPRERLGLIAVSSSVIGANGYTVPTFNRGDGARAGAPQVIAGISTPASLTIAETGGVDGANVRLELFDAAGVSKGGTTVAILRYGSKHFDDVSALANGASIQGGRINVTVEAGAASIVAVALNGGATFTSSSLSSGVSQSQSVVAMAYEPTADVPSVTTVVPVLAPPSSAGASPKFATSVGFLANSSLPATFSATLRSALGASPITRTIDVPAGTVKVYSDVGADLFGVSSASGSISVQTVAAGKVYAVLKSATAGTPYSTIPVQSSLSEGLTSAASGGQRALFYDGLEQSVDPSRGTRWMLVLNEVSGNSGIVDVRLYEAGNRTSPIAEKAIGISAYEQRQLDTIFGELGLEQADRKKDRTNVQVVVTAIGGTARVSAMAVLVDNKTGDAKTFALAPSVGSAVPSVNLVKAVNPGDTPPPPPGRRRTVKH